MKLGAWIRAMQAVGLQASLDDLRDIVWLAGQLGADGGGTVAPVKPAAPAPGPVAPAPTPAPAEAGATPRGARPLSTLNQTGADADDSSALYGAAAGSSGQRARRVQLRGAPALPQGLAIARALRPLSRRRPGRLLMLDERATAEFIADTGLRAPVYRPARERWFDIVLAVEDMPSMAAWQPVVAAFERLLQRQGGFRSVSRLALRAQGTQVQAYAPGGRRANPRALRERDGRRILLALSDCTSDTWHRGAMGAWLQQAAAELPVAVVQLLPPALWPNTAIGFAELRAWAPQVAAPAARLHVRRPGWAEGEPGLVLPVLALEPAAVAAWARMVAAAGDAWAGAALLPLPDNEAVATAAPVPEPDPAARAAAFRASATVDAQRLAAYFSVVHPLTPPVMRVIHQAMAPAGGAAALAQVFLGGLLRCLRSGATPDEAAYDFHPGLREQLQGGLTRQEFVQVNLALYDFLQQESGTSFDFFALIEDSRGSERLPEAARPFVQMARSAARRFGGGAPAAEPSQAPDARVGVVAEIRITAGGHRLTFVHRSARGESTVRHELPPHAEALLEQALSNRGESLDGLRHAALPRGLQDGNAYTEGPPWAELVLDEVTERYPWELLFRSQLTDRLPFALQRGLTRRPRGVVARTGPRAAEALVVAATRSRGTSVPAPSGARREAEATLAVLRQVVPGATSSLVDVDTVHVLDALKAPSSLRVLHLAAQGERQAPSAAGEPEATRVSAVLTGGHRMGLQDLALAMGVPELIYLAVDHAAALAPRLLQAGAAVVVAPTGAIDDEAAVVFAEVFYAVLATGQSLLEATHQARAACHQRLPDSDAWGRFQVWGDPAWRLVDDDAAPAPIADNVAEPAVPDEAASAALAPLPSLSECQYLAYLSYAHADDQAWFNWITDFGNELERGLSALMRGVRLPRLHRSAETGPVNGLLVEQLSERINASFALIVAVHDNFVHSEWCLHEVEAFVNRYGREAALQRLYILALSEDAIQALVQTDRWRRIFGEQMPLWLPFYDTKDHDRPLDIYLERGLIAPQFRSPFERLRSDFVAKLRADPGRPEPTPAPTPAPAGTITAIGFVAPASQDGLRLLVQQLAQRGIDTRQLRLLSQDQVFADFAAMAGAGRLVLPFDDEPLLLASLSAGGHLQLQREAWLKRGGAPEQVFWLDLRQAVPPRSSWRGAAAWVVAQGFAVHGLASLAQVLQTPGAGDAEADPVPQTLRVYIESNRHERTLWEPLGALLQRRWSELFAQLPDAPPALRARGLPVDQIDSFPDLDDADGLVLLWGRKTTEALVAQINKLEGKLASSPDTAPGIVAYLMPPNTSPEPIPAWGWKVLRFDASNEAQIQVLPQEQADLDRFLRSMLNRHLRRIGAPPLAVEPRAPKPFNVLVVGPSSLGNEHRLLVAAIGSASDRFAQRGRELALHQFEVDDKPLSPAHLALVEQIDFLVLLVDVAVQPGLERVVGAATDARRRLGGPALQAWFFEPQDKRPYRGGRGALSIEQFRAGFESQRVAAHRFQDSEGLARSVLERIEAHLDAGVSKAAPA